MYYVVFEGTGKPKSYYKGIRTFIGYKSKEDFDESRARNGGEDIIVAEGVTTEVAQQLISLTTGEARALAAYDSVERESSVLAFELGKAAFLAIDEGHKEGYTDELRRIYEELMEAGDDNASVVRVHLLGLHF